MKQGENSEQQSTKPTDNPAQGPETPLSEVILHASDIEGNFKKIVACYEDHKLLIKNTQGGPLTLQYMNVYDFTHTITINAEFVVNFCSLLGADKKNVLMQLAARFSGENSYTEITRLLTENQIDFEDNRLIFPPF